MTDDSRHPSYPNPTVTEALCEIHFALGPGTSWKPTLPGDLFKSIQTEFPEMEPVVEVGVQVEFGPQGIGQKFLPPAQRARYRHASRPLLLQLSENVFTVNVLPKYPGWDVMRHDVVSAWTTAKRVLHSTAVTRIGLRYINIIPRESPNERAGDWLKPTRYIPAAILESNSGFLLRLEAHMGNENRVIVTLGDAPPEAGSIGSIVFDIDRIVERGMDTSLEVLEQQMNRLHDDVWEMLSAAKNERLERLLQRTPK